MRVEPTLDEVVNGERGMLAGIAMCLREQCLVSAVSLIFASIDALAALTRPVDADDTTGELFKDWVGQYLLRPGSTLSCDSEDLWGARCGVLHTYNAESRAQRQGLARRLVYQWRSGPPADAALPLPEDALLIEIEALHEAFCNAVDVFLAATDGDLDLRDRVLHHLATLLCYRPWPVLEGRVAA